MKIMLRLSMFLLGLIVFSINAMLLVLRPANDEPYWIVYADSFGIQKVQVNGDAQEEILPGSWTIHGVNKDWVYFTLDIPDPYATVMRVRLDGTDMQPLSRSGMNYKALAVSGQVIVRPVNPFGAPDPNSRSSHGTTRPVVYSTQRGTWHSYTPGADQTPGNAWQLTSPDGNWVLTYRLDHAARPVIYKTGVDYDKVQQITKVDAFMTNPTPFWIPKTRVYNGMPLLTMGMLLMLFAFAPRFCCLQTIKLAHYFPLQRLLPIHWQPGRPHRV